MSEKANWSIAEDVALLEAWVLVTHDPINGNEMRVDKMWKKIHAFFVEKMQGTPRTEQSMSSRYRHLHKELKSWKEAITRAETLYRSGDNRANEELQAQMWFNQANNNRSFTRHNLWDLVKHTPKYKIVHGGPEVVLNETPLHESSTQESPLEEASGTPNEPVPPTEPTQRPIGRKAAKKKAAKGSSSTNEYSKIVEEFARQHELNREHERQVLELNRARDEALERDREFNRQERELKRRERQEELDREIMSRRPEQMTPNSKRFWTKQRDAVMRRHFPEQDEEVPYIPRDDGPSTTNWIPRDDE